MTIDEGFLKQLVGKKKEKCYQKYEVAKHELDEIKQQEEEIILNKSKVSGDEKSRLDKEWKNLEIRKKQIEEKVNKFTDTLERVKLLHLEQSLLRKIETIGSVPPIR